MTIHDTTVPDGFWFTSLPAMTSCQLVAANDSSCLVSTADYLARVTATGDISWLLQYSPPWVGGLIQLTTGQLARLEGESLTVRDPNTGAVAAVMPGAGVTALIGAPDGDVLYLQRDGAGIYLVKTAITGRVAWRHRLHEGAQSGPVVVDDTVIVADGARLRAYDLAGHALWSADHRGFHTATSQRGKYPADPRSDDDATHITGPLTILSPDLLLAELATAKRRLHLFDLRAATVRPLLSPVSIHQPLISVASPLSPPRIAALGSTITGSASARWTVVLLDLSGRVHWTHETAGQPRSLHSDAHGNVLVACSPSGREWQSYRPADECFVRCLTTSGQPQWTWPLPDALAGKPILGSRGQLYLPVSTGLTSLPAAAQGTTDGAGRSGGVGPPPSSRLPGGPA